VKLKDELTKELKENFKFAQEMNEEQLDTLLKYSTVENLPSGHVLAESIGDCKGMVLILSGEIKISRMSEDGREVTVYRLGQGSTCPLSAVCILGQIREKQPMKVMTEKHTRILWISPEYIAHHLFECEPFCRFIFGCIANRLYDAMDVVDDLAFVPIRKRLAQKLIGNSNYGRHPVYITHEALARELGTVREVISRELKALEKAGIVQLQRGRMTILDQQKLVEMIE
jgi:CRP/FNR family transcriptional regulator